MRLTLTLKTLRDRWRTAVAWAGAAMVLCAIQLYVYPSVRDSGQAMNEFLEAFPAELIVMFRIEDYTTGAGFLGTELFSVMLPLVFIGVGTSWGASAAAEEEERGTSEVLYALPIRRTGVLLSKLVACWFVVVAVAFLLVVELTLGSALVDLDLGGVDLVAATASCACLGLFFNALAMAVGAVWGSRGVALGVSLAVGIISFFIFALAPLVDSFDAVIAYVPFDWALGQNPLKNGVDWLGLAWLSVGSIVSYSVALVAIDRRDLDA
jgi:ABC-2 type transport system permease protein